MDRSPKQTAAAVHSARVLRGVAWAVVSMAMFTLTPVFVRFLSSEMHAVEIIFHRSAIAAVALAAWFLWRDISRLRTRVLKAHMGRSVLNFAGMALWFQAIVAMPLAEATALHFTLPSTPSSSPRRRGTARPAARTRVLLRPYAGRMAVLNFAGDGGRGFSAP